MVLKQDTQRIDFLISGFVKGAESNIDTLRNQLITAIETAVESDITRGGNALDTMVVACETDEGSYSLLCNQMTIRCMYEYQSGTP